VGHRCLDVLVADCARPAGTAPLFDHLVGAQLEFATDREPKRLGGLQVDGKLELGRLLDRKIGWP
jgi:hypothetical protein